MSIVIAPPPRLHISTQPRLAIPLPTKLLFPWHVETINLRLAYYQPLIQNTISKNMEFTCGIWRAKIFILCIHVS